MQQQVRLPWLCQLRVDSLTHLLDFLHLVLLDRTLARTVRTHGRARDRAVIITFIHGTRDEDVSAIDREVQQGEGGEGGALLMYVVCNRLSARAEPVSRYVAFAVRVLRVTAGNPWRGGARQVTGTPGLCQPCRSEVLMDRQQIYCTSTCAISTGKAGE